MTFQEALHTFLEWIWGLITNIGVLWTALIEPRPLLSAWLGFDVSLLGLVGAGALIFGILHAILGFIID